MIKKICDLCNNNVCNIKSDIDIYLSQKCIDKKNAYYLCDKCLKKNSYIILPDNNIDFAHFYLKIFISDDILYVIRNEWKDYIKNFAHKRREEERKIEIDKILVENKLENIKPSIYKSYIKFGVPNIENIIFTFKKEQDQKENRLYKLINELKKKNKEYDENIPVFEKYITDGGDIKKIIEEGELEKSLIYNTNYKNYLKHNSVSIARYLATIEFMNSGKHNDIIHKFASEKNTLNFH